MDEEDVQDQLAVVVHDGGFAVLFQAWEIRPYRRLNVSPEGLLASRTHTFASLGFVFDGFAV